MTKKDLENNKIVKQLRGQLDELTERADKEIKTLHKKAQKHKTYTQVKKRVSEVEKQIEKEVEKRHNQLLDLLGVASKEDLKRLNKKLNSIARKVNGFSKAAA